MSIDNLYDFFKKINYSRFLTIILCPVLMFLCSFPSYAFTKTDTLLPVNIVGYCRIMMNNNGSLTTLYEGLNVTPDSNNVYVYGNSKVTGNDLRLNLNLGPNDFYTFPFDPINNDYYFISTVTGQGSIADFTFYPTTFNIAYTTHDNTKLYYPLENLTFYHTDATGVRYGFSTIAKVNFETVMNNGIGAFEWFGNTGTFPANLHVECAFLMLPKNNESSGSLQGVINAIDEQTDLIMNSGSGFGGTSSGILSGNEQLSGFIDDYTQIEQSMYDKFTENQSAVIGNFSGFSWGSLSTAVDWTSDYLNRIYDNSGDFRTMFMYPILAGIALIFIGRQGLTAYVRSRREK